MSDEIELPVSTVSINANCFGLAFTITGECTAAQIDPYLDLARRAANRLTARWELGRVRATMLALTKDRMDLDNKRLVQLKKIAADKMRQRVGFEATGRSVALTANQTKRLEQYDAAVEKLEEQYAADCADLDKKFDEAREQEARQLAIISGQEKSDAVLTVGIGEVALGEAAE